MIQENGMLYRTRCYLSGSMEYTSDGRTWRTKVKEELKSTGVLFFDPYDKPFVTSLPEDEAIREEMKKARAEGNLEYVADYFRHVRADDLRLCDVSDFGIIHIEPKVSTWGTAEEFVTLNRMKKPIFMAVEGGRNNCPLWVLGTIPPKYIYNSVDEIIDVVNGINNRTIEIDSSRWRLLKPELR